MKKLLILFVLIFSSNLIHAHCGSCGVGDENEKKTHTHSKKFDIKDLNLTSKQMKKYESIEIKYKESISKIEAKYEKELLAILNKKQKEKYEKNDMKCFTCKNCFTCKHLFVCKKTCETCLHVKQIKSKQNTCKTNLHVKRFTCKVFYM